MQNEFSNKLRLLLNELAILNQPEKIDGKYFFNVDTLKKLKNMSAEVYLCADQLLNGVTFESHTPAPSHVALSETMVTEEVVSNVIVPAVETNLTETINSVAEVPAVEMETELQIAEVEFIEPEPIIPPIIVSSNNEEPLGLASDIFKGKISITRKFEYINNLFGGNAAEFSDFLNDISNATDSTQAMEIFIVQFETRNWKRKSETADDLKSMIRKVKI